MSSPSTEGPPSRCFASSLPSVKPEASRRRQTTFFSPLMLYDCASKIESETVLFHDAFTTNLAVPGITFRRVTESDKGCIFPHTVEPVGEGVIEVGREVAVTGGILFHYNIPYGDIYM